MKFKNMDIENFRRIERCHIDFHDNINVFVGVNGSGKTSFLETVALVSSALVSSKEKFNILDTDITKTKQSICIKAEVEIGSKSFSTLLEARMSEKRFIKSDNIKKLDINKADLPLAVYYGVMRTVNVVPLRIRPHTYNNEDAYKNAFTRYKTIDFKTFFEWFRNTEDYENELKREGGSNNNLPQLEAVRKAIYKFIPSFSELRVRRKPLQMVVKKTEKGRPVELSVTQLSDGEKCLLALVGDIARRLALANKSDGDPLNGNAIIIIDEIELHLHPQWQKTVVNSLRETFPNCQFIISTHSPLVIGGLNPENVKLINIDNDGMAAISDVHYSLGLKVDDVLNILMGVQPIDNDIQSAFDEIGMLVINNKFQAAESKLDELRKKLGDNHPEIVYAGSYITTMKPLS